MLRAPLCTLRASAWTPRTGSRRSTRRCASSQYGIAVANRTTSRLFIIGYNRDPMQPNDMKVFRVTGDIPFKK